MHNDLPGTDDRRGRRSGGRGASNSADSMMTQMTSLHELRLDHVFQKIKSTDARRVLDLGCGSGSLLYRLCGEVQFEEIVGLEESGQSLLQARSMLANHLEQGARLRLLRGSYAERQPALTGFDCAAMVETIEHVNPAALSKVELAVFAGMRPSSLFMTTPNREYNPLLDLAPGEFREPDHKFEWDRFKFQQWARGVAGRNGYRVSFGGIGEYHAELGQPTQTAFFELC